MRRAQRKDEEYLRKAHRTLGNRLGTSGDARLGGCEEREDQGRSESFEMYDFESSRWLCVGQHPFVILEGFIVGLSQRVLL